MVVPRSDRIASKISQQGWDGHAYPDLPTFAQNPNNLWQRVYGNRWDLMCCGDAAGPGFYLFSGFKKPTVTADAATIAAAVPSISARPPA